MFPLGDVFYISFHTPDPYSQLLQDKIKGVNGVDRLCLLHPLPPTHTQPHGSLLLCVTHNKLHSTPILSTPSPLFSPKPLSPALRITSQPITSGQATAFLFDVTAASELSVPLLVYFMFKYMCVCMSLTLLGDTFSLAQVGPGGGDPGARAGESPAWCLDSCWHYGGYIWSKNISPLKIWGQSDFVQGHISLWS